MKKYIYISDWLAAMDNTGEERVETNSKKETFFKTIILLYNEILLSSDFLKLSKKN